MDDEDEAFLRPAPSERKQPRASRRVPDLVPNYDPALDPAGDAEPYLRTRRRVPPRKGSRVRLFLLRSRPGRILLAIALLLVLGTLAAGLWVIRSFLQHDSHFRIDSSASIEATGNTELGRPDLLRVFGSDLGRNIFFVPLARREAALEAEPWVRHATVMRLLPHSLRVTIEERTPIAFVRVGHTVELADREGVLLPMAPATLAARHYSFPVVVGLDPGSPPEARAARMHVYEQFVAALDGGPDKVSSQLSEVDLLDPDDVRAVVPAQGSDILLHFGNSDYLQRWRSYQQHLPEWRQQYPGLRAVDLRYDRQVVLKMADAAQADEVSEEKAPAAQAGEAAIAPTHRPNAGSNTRPVHHPAASVPAKLAPAPSHHLPARPGTWYTQRRGPHHSVRWVPHFIAHAGRVAQ